MSSEEDEGSFQLGDQESEELDEEEERASPLQIVEERIYFIQGCLDEDPENEILYAKHEEYFDLYDQLQEVSKKLARVEKLLAQQPSTKLEKKRMQYIRNVEETVQYVLNDDFFLPPDENNNDDDESSPRTKVDLRNCFVRVSSCLGQPLESIIEMPGMEGEVSLRKIPGLTAMNLQGSSGSLSAGMQSSISRMQASAERGLDLVSVLESNDEDDDDNDEPLVSPLLMRGRKNMRVLDKKNDIDDGLHMSENAEIAYEPDSDEEAVSD